jgi:hypothetical protein
MNGVIRRHDIPDSTYIEFGDRSEFACVGLIRGLFTTGTATLIDPHTVLTAAHVVKNEGEEALFEIYNPLENKTVAIKGRVQIHKDFVFTKNAKNYVKGIYSDLALIHLSSPIYFVSPANLDYEKKSPPFSFCSVGFGKTKTESNSLLFFDLKKRGFTNKIRDLFISNWCDESFIAYFDPPHSEESTSLEGIGAMGDSGSGAFTLENGTFSLFGIITSLHGKGNYGSYNLITPLHNYQDWIEENRHKD